MPKAKTQAGAAITHSGSGLDYDAVAAHNARLALRLGTTALPLGFKHLFKLNSRLDIFLELTT